MIFAAACGLAQAQVPPLQTSGADVAASNERTALVRATGKLASTVDVKVKNTGDRALLPPVHAVIAFTPLNGGNLTGLTVPGALGGIGKAPYQTFYKDLSAAIGEGLAVGAETTFSFAFERPQDSSVSYAVTIHGNRNRDPVASIGGPYSGQQGAVLRFDASGSTDPDGDALTYAWDFGDGTTASEPVVEHAYATTGLFTVTLLVRDARGAVVTRETQVPLAPSGVFALARTRTLDGNGHPLGEVTIEQTGPDGARTLRSDAVSGFTSLGGAPGAHRWRFERAGYLTSFRKTTLNQGQVKVVAFPWMAALSTQRAPLSLLNPTEVKSPTERVVLTFPPESFEQAESVAITELNGQTLPLPLPFGWSPLAAFQVDIPAMADADVAAALKLLEPVAAGQALAFVQLDEDALAWQTVALLSGSGDDSVAVTLRKPGSYAVVIADTLPTGNPAAAVVGEPLPAGDAPTIASEVTAVGEVNPGSSVSSLEPARVTAAATVDFTNASQPLASGAWFLAEVEETYDLNDGRALKTPDYDATFYVYQHPGDDAPPTATATFPLRPRILFGPDQLTEAHIKVAVLRLNEFSGGIVTPEGALLSLAGVQLRVPAGAVDRSAAAELRLLSTASLSRFPGGFQALMAFDLNLPAMTGEAALDLTLTQKLAPNSHFVLARCVGSGSESGLQPVLRLRSDALGSVTIAEPASGAKLPGITGSGQYVIVQIAEPEALISGLVRQPGGAAFPGALVRVSGEPWLSLTGPDGGFFTLAKPGERVVTGTNPLNGDYGRATAALADAAATASVEIQTAPTGPQVVATLPVAGETKASPVAPIAVEFSEALAPASFGADALRLRVAGASSDVPGSFTLELTNRRASFFPTNPLADATNYEILVSSALRDAQGLPIEGTLVFPFKTRPAPARGEGAQLTIYEPGASGHTAEDQALIDAIPGYRPGQDETKVVAIGSAGSADPEVPVILTNETTGETATVLSKPDGSFANFIEAAESDFISATFVNANGTRITIPATRQKFDDGRTGLYATGGTLEASNDEAGKVEIIVEPGSVTSRTVFKLNMLSVAQLNDVIGGTQPDGGKAITGFRLEESGDLTKTYSNVKIPVNPAELDLPPGMDPAEATYALTVPRDIDGTIVYQVIDGLKYEDKGDGKPTLATASPPFVGLLVRQLAALRRDTGLVDRLAEKGTQVIADGAITTVLPIGVYFVPVIIFNLASTNLHGHVYTQRQQVPVEGQSQAPFPLVPLGGALIRLAPPGNEFAPKFLRAGEFITVSEPDGSYIVRLPLGMASRAVASHRRFPFQASHSGIANSGLISGKQADFIFKIPPPQTLAVDDTAGPLIEVRQLTTTGTTGSGAEAGMLLDVTATDDVSLEFVDVKLEDFGPLIGSQSLIQSLSSEELQAMTPAVEIADDDPSHARSHERWRVKSGRSGRATYLVTASDGVNELVFFRYLVAFTGGAAEPVADRVVSFSWPPPGTEHVARGTPIRLRFSHALTPQEIDELTGPPTEGVPPMLTLSPSGISILNIEVSLDRRELTVAYWAPQAAGNELTLSLDPTFALKVPAFSDLEDGKVVAVPSEPFVSTIKFATPSSVAVDTQPSGQFGGIVQVGGWAYSLERAAGDGGKLHHYRVEGEGTAAAKLAHVGEVELGETVGRPMDLVAIPDYALRHIDGVVDKEASYLVVYGGPIHAIDGVAPLKRAFIYRLNADGVPEPYFTGGKAAVLSESISTVTRARWDPPFLSFMEIGAGGNAVGLTTFNGLITGVEGRALNQLVQNPLGREGVDLNNDGDYADDQELAPIPPPFAGLASGLEFSWQPANNAQRVSDYDFSADFGLLCAVYRGIGVPHGFSVVLGGPSGLMDEGASVTFAEEPKRVQLLPRQRVLLEEGGDSVRDLAMVSCISSGEAANGLGGTLIVIDLTDAAAPVIAQKAQLPAGIGTLNSVVQRADGLLAVSTTPGGLFLLDPRLLLLKRADGTTAALRQQLEGLETNVSSFASSATGLNLGSAGSQIRPALSAPLYQVVRFEGMAPEAASTIAATVRAAGGPAGAWDQRLLAARNVELGSGAAVFDQNQPLNPDTHHYVIVHASGLLADSSGRLPLAAAAVDEAGRPMVPGLSNRCPTFIGEEKLTKELAFYGALKVAHFLAAADFSKPAPEFLKEVFDEVAPLAAEELLAKLMETAPVYPHELTAHRLSSDKSSALYNTYLAGPIVLLHKDLDKSALTEGFIGSDGGGAGGVSAVKRVCLRASPWYWVGLAPRLKDNKLSGAFTSVQNNDLTVEFDTKVSDLFNDAKGIFEQFASGNEAGGIFACLQAVAKRVDSELEVTMQPGHVTLVNFGFRRNPVVFLPGIMASRLYDPAAEQKAQLRWISFMSGVLAHLGQTIEPGDQGKLVQLRADLAEQLSERLRALAYQAGADGAPGTPLNGGLDTLDVLRRVTLMDIIKDAQSTFDDLPGVLGFVVNAITSVLSRIPILGTLISAITDDLTMAIMKPLLEKINEPIYQNMLLYLQGYLGYEEYAGDGTRDSLTQEGANWASLKSSPDLFVFPYDWRQDNATTAAELRELVKIIRIAHPDTPQIDLLTHSMGGLVARRFILDNPGAVERCVSIVAPYLGATKALYATKTGDFDEFMMSVFVPQDNMKVITRHLPAVHQLMPSRALLEQMGLRPLRENGWDLDGDGNAFESFDATQYAAVLDGEFFKVRTADLPANATDRGILEAQPKPMATNSEPFHTGKQDNWSGDAPGVRYTHLVCLQALPRTITTLTAKPVLVGEPFKADVSLALPPVQFFDSENPADAAEPVLPETTEPLKLEKEKAFRLSWTAEIGYGPGDSTVPFLSQTRGYKSAGSLNEPRAAMFPLLNPSGQEEDDGLVSHNGVLNNPQLLSWLGKALQDQLVANTQPQIAISGGGGNEGTATTFTATFTNEPTQAGLSRRVHWDMGDGTLLSGDSVTHAYASDGDYIVTCAASWEPGGTDLSDAEAIAKRPTFGAVAALKTTVADATPGFTLTLPETIEVGKLAEIRLNLNGAAAGDAERFIWTFGDGSPAPEQENNYVIQHVYRSVGSFNVSVEVFDDDGSSNKVTGKIKVEAPPDDPEPADTAARRTLRVPRVDPPVPFQDATGVERVEIRIIGNTADTDDLTVLVDSQLAFRGEALASLSGASVRRGRDEPEDSGGRRVQYIRLSRLQYRGNDILTPDQTSVGFHGLAPTVEIRMRYFRPGAPVRCFAWWVNYHPADPFNTQAELLIPWAEMPNLTDATMQTLFVGPTASYTLVSARQEPCEERSPALNGSRDMAPGKLAVDVEDNTVPPNPTDTDPDGDPDPTEPDDRQIFAGLPQPRPSAEPGATPVSVSDHLDGQIVYPVDKTQVAKATEDAPPGVMADRDIQFNARVPTGNDCPEDINAITDEQIEEIKSTVQDVFSAAAALPFFRQFVFNLDDLWLFEQGSGALLWRVNGEGVSEANQKIARQKINAAYIFGKSDHDYEIMLPCFKKALSETLYNPNDPHMFALFPQLAHQPSVLEGDWYFKRPHGLLADGTDMGPPPDPEDTVAYNSYVAAARFWRYNDSAVGAPEFATLELMDASYEKGAKPLGEAKSIFDHPATPAEVIVHVLRHLVTSDENVRKTLKDVTFFPVRREHVEFACLSLDKPPPAGDDPVGDAGMGRQLLLLKWLMEGTFLPPFGDYNDTAHGPEGADLRTIFFNRLLQRKDLVEVEGYEWALFHQWAALKAGSTLRVGPQGASNPAQAASLAARAKCQAFFGDYLDAHDDAVMKKVGKAAIRGTLAALAADDDAREGLFSMTPAQFDADVSLPTFEHFIARRALAAEDVFEVDDLPALMDDFLQTKAGSSRKFCQIRERSDGVNQFILAAHQFLAAVQESTGDNYYDTKEERLKKGFVNEIETRTNNAQAIEFGFNGVANNRLPGRLPLAGEAPQPGFLRPDLSYPFIVTLAKNQTTHEVPGIRVHLSGGMPNPIIAPPLSQVPLVFPANQTALVVNPKNADGSPLLNLRRPAQGVGQVLQHRLELVIEDEEDQEELNAFAEDDVAPLESVIMSVPHPHDPELIPAAKTRWVYRGMFFEDKIDPVSGETITSQQQLQQMIDTQLRQGRLDSQARLAGLDDTERERQLLIDAKAIRDGNNGLEGFSNEDLRAMTDPELLAVQHLGPPLQAIGISTAEDMFTAIHFAMGPASRPPHPSILSVVLAFEVPVDAGIQYVRTATRGPNGEPVRKWLNPGEEGREVVFFHEVKFSRCLAFEVLPSVPLHPSGFFLVHAHGPFINN